MSAIMWTVQPPAAPGEEIRTGRCVTYVALWHGAVGYCDLVVATDGRRYAIREAPPGAGGTRRWTAVRRYPSRPPRQDGPATSETEER